MVEDVNENNSTKIQVHEFSTSSDMVICGWSSPLHRWHKAFTSHRVFVMHLSPQTRVFSHRDSHPVPSSIFTAAGDQSAVAHFFNSISLSLLCTSLLHLLSLCKFTTSSSHGRCVLLHMNSSHVHVNAFYHSLIMMVAFEVLTKHLVTHDH